MLIQVLLVAVIVATANALCPCNHLEVTAAVLNYRRGPYPADILGQVKKGDCLEYVGMCGSWYKMRLGCVSPTYVQYSGQCSAASSSQSSTCMTGMCAGRTNVQRGCDGYGCGHYNASRNGGTHRGSDIKCIGGEYVTAPFDGKVVRQAVPYISSSCENNGFLYQSTDANFPGLSVKVFYANGYTVGANVQKGGIIAKHIGLHCKYSSSMTDHIHVEVYNNNVRVDPTSYLYCS